MSCGDGVDTSTHTGRIKIHLVGPFRVESADGEDLTPRGRKACALLAILALSATRSRSRACLQDKLWSDRAPEQGSASLRQALSEIRKSLGRYRDCLQSDLRVVSLTRDRVGVDLETLDLAALAREQRHDPPRLLEDLDLRDPEFEHWLRDQRMSFEQELESAPDGVQPAAPMIEATPAQHSAEALRPWVRIAPPQTSSGESGAFVAHLVGQTIASGIAERGGIEIREHPCDLPGIEIRVDVLPLPQAMCILVALVSAHSQVQLWSGTQSIPSDPGFLIDSPQLLKLTNQAIDIATLHLGKMLSDRPETCATTFALSAVEKMFRLDCRELDKADDLLGKAYELDPRGIFLAWRGYARTFYIGEHGSKDTEALMEEAEALSRQAMEKAPYDSTVLALASYVYSFLLRDYNVGHELADKSLKYNSANALGRAYLGRVKSYMGDHDEGYRHTALARKISGPAPFQYTFDFLCGITALLSGRFDEAVRLGELSRTLAPTYRPPQRYLVPLYLRMGERAKARDVFESLRKVEPDFSLDAMREKSYPSTGLKEAGLLEFSDNDL